MHEHEKIDHVEFPALDLVATKAFFAKVFVRTLEDFGPDYTDFASDGLL